MKPDFKCCDVETACGRNLWQGVVFVGIATLVISTVTLLSSISYISSITGQSHNGQPVAAINLLIALVAITVSCYQIIVSLLLLWQAFLIKGNNIFLCSVWYVSHLSIVALFGLLFTCKIVICFRLKFYMTAAMTMLFGIAYEGLFAYFSVIVNSYLHSLDQDRYL